jgi:hypothetical protein
MEIALPHLTFASMFEVVYVVMGSVMTYSVIRV